MGDVVLDRRVQADVVLRPLRQEPAVLQQLVVQLGRVHRPAQFHRHRPHGGPEHVPHPAVREDLGAGRMGVPPARAEPRAWGRVPGGVVLLGGHPGLQVVQEPAGLVLLGVQTGQPQQLPLVVPGVDDLRHERHRVTGGRALDLHLGHVETEVVQPPDAPVDVVVLARRVHRGAGQLPPQPGVPVAYLRAELDRVHRGVQRPGGLQVEQFPADVHPGQIEVVVALPLAQPRLQLTGLGIHQIRGIGARVPPEQGVRQ
nr:hypothetical protein [Streptomyces sp. MH191]